MVEFDEKLGIIRSVVSGVQSTDDVNTYMAELRACVAQAKRSGGKVLHLVDARQAQVQPTSTNEAIAGFANADNAGVDRVAVIMQSQLLKMQSNRLYGDLPVQVFGNEREALDWLLQ